MDTLGLSLTDPVRDHFHVRSRLNRPDPVMPGPKAFGTDFVCYVVSSGVSKNRAVVEIKTMGLLSGRIQNTGVSRQRS